MMFCQSDEVHPIFVPGDRMQWILYLQMLKTLQEEAALYPSVQLHLLQK